MNAAELKASDLILDAGVRIPVRPLRFLMSKKKPRSIVMRHPYEGSLMRISGEFLRIGVTHEEMASYSVDENIAFIAKHGKAVSRIVAAGIVRGYFSYRLFGRAVAWWLRWRVHPVFLSEAMFQLFANIQTSPFLTIIRLAQAICLTRPRLSRTSDSGS